MIKKFCNWLLYSVLGWKKDITIVHPGKYVLCMAPHTSNWDFIIGLLYSRAEGMKINFLMKKEWFFWPLGGLFRHLGGIPVYRDKHTSLTDRLAKEAEKSDHFALCVTPEGTRSLNPDWKLGFYYIALKAGIPILLYAVDYKDKLVKCTKSVVPNGDVDHQLTEIKLYYKDIVARHPNKFTIGEIK